MSQRSAAVVVTTENPQTQQRSKHRGESPAIAIDPAVSHSTETDKINGATYRVHEGEERGKRRCECVRGWGWEGYQVGDNENKRKHKKGNKENDSLFL